MTGIIPYGTLTNSGNLTGRYIQVSEPALHDLLRLVLPQVEVDEVWYLSTYGDVAEAVQGDKFRSAKEHYVAVGYFEGRFPRDIIVDETWYLASYADVGEAVRRGRFESGQEHFKIGGFREGRLPYAGWEL